METKKDPFEHIKTTGPVSPGADYFEKLKADLLVEIRKEPKAPIKTLVHHPFFWVISAAASIVLLFAIRAVLNEPLEASISFSSLSNDEILTYVEQNIDDFDEEMIADVYNAVIASKYGAEGDTTKKRTLTVNEIPANVSQTSATVTFETLSEEDILNYLNSQELTEEELEESVEGSGD
jgi:hypothetical protein